MFTEDGCYFIVCLNRLINHMCLKCLASSLNHALSGARHMVNGCVDCALFNAVLNVYPLLKDMTNAKKKQNIAIMLQRRQCREEKKQIIK